MPAAEPDLGLDEDAEEDAGTAAGPDGAGGPEAEYRRWGVLLVVGGALGLLAAVVLTVDRFRLLQDPDTPLACNLNPFISCGPVMQSRAGALFGFPNPLLGIIGFTVLLTTGVAVLAGARFPAWYHRGLQVGVLAGAVFITWLQTQSLYVIGALCLWCLLVWTVTIPVVVVVTLRNLALGHLAARWSAFGTRLRPYAPTVVAVWYLLVLGAIALRFYREFALIWFGVAV